jgi:hypothetical protein
VSLGLEHPGQGCHSGATDTDEVEVFGLLHGEKSSRKKRKKHQKVMCASLLFFVFFAPFAARLGSND